MMIQQKQDGHKGSFYIEENGRLLAEMTYSMTNPQLMIIDHTEVDDKLRGKNIGYQLVHAAVEHARMQAIKIIPLCPFAKSVFDKKKAEMGDVLRTN
jgi:uncharacterized protein